MKIANLAVNGMASHWSKVRDWLQEEHPDIVTLQKIGPERNFPKEELLEIGYRSNCLGGNSHGDRGVAVLSHSRLPQPEVLVFQLPGAEREESRFLTVNIDGFWASSVYAPYDEEGLKRKQPAIDRRVTWLNRLRNHVRDSGYHCRDSVLCGDFNVKLEGSLRTGYYSERERDALKELLSHGSCDLFRRARHDDRGDPGYTFGFHIRPIGTSRLHLALGSKSLARRLRGVRVDVDSRPQKQAAPIVVDLDCVRA